jgi:glycosyltransferase involved in cell wall biosynthesis
MKIYGLMLVKNEEDIIESTLREGAKWCDKLIVMDNGSSDKTWEIVNQLSEELSVIIPFCQHNQSFKIGLRSIMFDQFKSELTSDDWWCVRMDADEFYLDNPRQILKDIPSKYRLVYKASIDFFITHEDLQDYNFSGNFSDDKNKIMYYQPYTWSEMRFVRHSKKLKWDISKFIPSPTGLIFPRQIRILHYQFRSPEQMKKRFETRLKAKNENCGSFKHEKGADWKSYLKHRNELVCHSEGEDFTILGNRNKFNKPYKRIVKQLLTLLRYY